MTAPNVFALLGLPDEVAYHTDEVLHHLVEVCTIGALNSRLAGRLDRALCYRTIGEQLAQLRHDLQLIGPDPRPEAGVE